MTPADEAIDPELSRGEPVAKGFNILCGNVGQDDGFHTGFDDGLSSFVDIPQSGLPSKQVVHKWR